MKKLTVILEKDGSDEIAGRVSTDQFLQVTVGATEQEVIDNLRDLIDDFIIHDGDQYDEWRGVEAADIEFDIEYDLTSFFALFGQIKINGIAKLAGINETLLRQYASGTKTASAAQVAKVQTAVHQLGERMTRVSLVAA
jgi:hypothetical protein